MLIDDPCLITNGQFFASDGRCMLIVQIDGGLYLITVSFRL